jgi:hypothetical protein
MRPPPEPSVPRDLEPARTTAHVHWVRVRSEVVSPTGGGTERVLGRAPRAPSGDGTHRCPSPGSLLTLEGELVAHMVLQSEGQAITGHAGNP